MSGYVEFTAVFDVKPVEYPRNDKPLRFEVVTIYHGNRSHVEIRFGKGDEIVMEFLVHEAVEVLSALAVAIGRANVEEQGLEDEDEDRTLGDKVSQIQVNLCSIARLLEKTNLAPTQKGVIMSKSKSKPSPQSLGGKAVAQKHAPDFCPRCGKEYPWCTPWHEYLGHLGLHGLADKYFNGDMLAAQARLRQNGLARQDPAPWNGAWPSYRPVTGGSNE